MSKTRLTFPTEFAREQNSYVVKDGTKMYLFDERTQFIYKISFKLGHVSGDGLDKYVEKSYSAVEKKFYVDNYDILFSRRDFRETGALATDPYFCQVNDIQAPDVRWQEYRFDSSGNKQVINSYIFLNDQLVYDPQLDKLAFRADKKTFDILSSASTFDGHPPTFKIDNADATKQAAERAKVEIFDSYADQLISSKEQMADKTWIRRFAQKHFLLIFKANHVNPNPRVFYGFPIKELRIHPYDQQKY